MRIRASKIPATLLEKSSVGGPQFIASWLLPMMPATPDTLVRFAKYGVTSVPRRLNSYLRCTKKRRYAMLPVGGHVNARNVCLIRKPKRFVVADVVR